MQRFLLLIITVIWVVNISAQSPHGKGFKINCNVCHTPEGWKFKNDNTFNHNKTGFPLVGQHKMLSCRQCHTSLVFSEAKNDCAACHKDMHQGTVGRDCQRCHTSQSWIVKNVKQIHRQKGFALVGAHASADCYRCHTSASQLRFDNLNNDCSACHRQQYNAAAITDRATGEVSTHSGFGFDPDCYSCHNMVGINWSYTGKGFEHGFFPLTGGHKNVSCEICHTKGLRKRLSPNCADCHVGQYNAAKTRFPAHTTKYLSYSCATCHNSQSWNSVKFKQHDGQFFKIYSGEHKGEWSSCTDCHSNSTTYNSNCKKCHD